MAACLILYQMNCAERDAMSDRTFVYILRCADGSLYTGWTNDLEKRLAAHNAGTASRCTRARRPVEMVYFEQRADKSDALRREAEIKRMTRAAKLALIASGGKDTAGETKNADF